MTNLEFLKSLRALVNYHRTCGVEHYRNSEKLRSGLRGLDGLINQRPAPVVPETAPPRQEKGGRAAACIGDLAVEIGRCRNCPLHSTRVISTAGSGGLQPKLLIVGDWLCHHHDRPGEQGDIFGPEQDRMLAKMVAAMGLEPGDIFVTNCIKCSVPESCTPTADQVSACGGFLRQQIGLLAPRLICTMGAAASQSLLDTATSLVQLRGRFHPYHMAADREIMVMPTFHPSYLLKNPEMKQPTWNDLLAVKRMLAQGGGRVVSAGR